MKKKIVFIIYKPFDMMNLFNNNILFIFIKYIFNKYYKSSSFFSSVRMFMTLFLPIISDLFLAMIGTSMLHKKVPLVRKTIKN